MSLQQLSKEDLNEMSLIELAHQLMEEKKQPYAFSDLVDELAGMLGLTQDEIRSRMVQFYTDLNIDGRFLNLGENRWGLRTWYPYDQIDEEVAPAVKSKKKKAKKAYEEEEEDLDLIDDDLDYDDLDDFEDDDLLDEEEDEEDETEDFVDLDEDDDAFDEDDELIDEDEYDLDVDDEEEDEEDFDEDEEDK